MLLGLSVPKLVLILCIGLLLFGGKRLPQLGRSLGEAIRGVRDGLQPQPELVPNDDKKEQR